MDKSFVKILVFLGLLSSFSCKDQNNPNDHPPSVPTLSLPTSNSTNVSPGFSLNWSSALRAKTYNLQVSPQPDFSSVIITATNISTTTYLTTGLSASTKYYWRVNAANAFGTSLWSDIWNFTTSIDVPPLVLPSNNATGVTNDISLSWSALSDAASYNLQLSSTADFSTTLVNHNSLTNVNFNLVGLTSGVKYYWRVSMNNSLGTSAWSDVWNFTTNPVPANGLVAYYPFNGNANDETGNGHQGVVSGSTLSTDRKGVPNRAYSFNGVDNYITVKDSLQELSFIGDFTVSAWYNSDGCQTPCAVPGYHTIIMKRDVSVGPGDDWPWGLSISYINGGSGNEFKKIYGTRRTNGIADYKWSADTVALNTWQHAVIVVQNNVQLIYINGVFDNSSPFTQLQVASTKNVNIGWNLRPGNEQFKGQIDDIRLYNRALSSQEVKILFLE